MKRLFACLYAVVLLSSTNISANAATTVATGSGWCIDFCNNTDTNRIENHLAADSEPYHNWFAFDIPIDGFSSASLNIWNDARNDNDDLNAVYNVYGATSITRDGLVQGPIFGSIDLAAANAGDSRYISINLNSLALSAINGSAGSIFVFGGRVPDANGRNSFSGSTGGRPIAFLEFKSAVPEPATWAFMIFGFGAVGGAIRRQRKATVKGNWA